MLKNGLHMKKTRINKCTKKLNKIKEDNLSTKHVKKINELISEMSNLQKHLNYIKSKWRTNFDAEFRRQMNNFNNFSNQSLKYPLTPRTN